MAVITVAEAEGVTLLPILLDLIGWSEGTSDSPATKNDGYDVIVVGADDQPEIFTDFSIHPFARGRAAKLIRPEEHGIPALYSTASGRYQIIKKTWLEYQPMLKLTDFRPLAQDQIALELIRERNALPLLQANDVAGAINALAGLWASMPGHPYPGQNSNTLEKLLVEFGALKAKAAAQ